MKTKAAMLTGLNRPWEVAELELDEPKEGEVLIRFVAAGPVPLRRAPAPRRHRAALPDRRRPRGRRRSSRRSGPASTASQEGDHVVCSFIPVCGHCRLCSTGQPNICDLGATILDGCMPDGTFRFHSDGQDVGAMCMLGTFSPVLGDLRDSCVKVDKDLPLEVAVLVGCGVPTGWGSAVYAADVAGRARPWSSTASAASASTPSRAPRHAGAPNVIAVDPLANKREMAAGARRHPHRRQRRGGARARRRS